MKCPNCASSVPDASNFCGVCGFDIRAAREAANSTQQTIAMNSENEVKALREQLSEVSPPEPEMSTDTVMDSAPSFSSNSEPSQPSVSTPPREPEAPPAPESPAFAPDVTTTQGVQINVSPDETFASMEAITPPSSGFRETQWFMAAEDPDHIENIENVVPTDLEGQYKNSGDVMDSQVRKQFSLNVQQTSSGTKGAHSASDIGGADVRAGVGQNKTLIGVVVALVAGVAAYFAFFQ